MNEALEQFVAQIPSTGDPVEIPLHLLSDPPPPQSPASGEHPAPGDPAVDLVELVSLPTFSDQWGMLHDMAGGMVQMRTGHPCALGDQARSEGGRVACEAAYGLISSNPALSRMILSPESTFFGQIAAVGMHGFACVQAVKASAQGQTIANKNAKLDEEFGEAA